MTKGKWVLVGIAVFALLLLLTALLVWLIVFGNKGPYSGTVVQQDGAAVAGVCVSDGRNVVKTDENGQFELPGYRKSRFIMLTVPAGYQTQAFYIAVDKNTKSYDFTLEASAATAAVEHSFLQISDTEIGEDGVGEWIDYVRGAVKETDAVFLMHTGDICYEAGLKQHIVDMNSQNMGTAVQYCIGNHDYVQGAYGEKLYESLYGPVWYSFDVGNVHYVVTPIQTGVDYLSGYHKNDRWRWLENDLANTDPDKQVVIFNHNRPQGENYVISFDRKELDLKQHNLAAWIFGHYHYNYVYEESGVVNISTARPDCGGIDQSASGVREVRMGKDGLQFTKMHYYDLQPEAPQEAAYSVKLEGQALFCDPLLVGDSLFVATVDDDYPRSCGVTSLDAATGAVRWFAKTANSVKNNLVVVGDSVFAQDCDGVLYCFNQADGALLWQKQLVLGEGALGTSKGICTDGKTIYAGGERCVSAVNPATGEVVWQYTRNSGEGSASVMVLAGSRLIVGAHWDALYAIDTATGKLLWENKDENLRFRSSTPAVLADGNLLVADTNAIMHIDVQTGEVTEKQLFDTYSFTSSAQPLLWDGVAYIATSQTGLVAYALDTKKILWAAETGPATVYTAPYVGSGAKTVESSPRAQGDAVVFGASDGYVYWINRKDGTQLKKQQVGAPVFGAPAIAQDAVLVADFAGRVVRLPS